MIAKRDKNQGADCSHDFFSLHKNRMKYVVKQFFNVSPHTSVAFHDEGDCSLLPPLTF